MEFLTVVLVALALGTDAFSLSVGVGVSGIRRREVYLLALAIALFHVLFPLTGITLGALLGRVVGNIAAIIGAIILALIGFQMIREGVKERQPIPAPRKFLAGKAGAAQQPVFTGLWGLGLLAGSVSLDSLTVGFGLGTMKAVSLAFTVGVIGAVAGAMTLAGIFLGKRMGRWLGDKALIAGGVILIGIGIVQVVR
ncbi:MAG: manganese efflux pump [Syntrophomonadaceae bacterium]|jgi:putative Mn2+ efflux pump MntP|nr:manganese efflux pump [Syntrophomonadaceae bacterium]